MIDSIKMAKVKILMTEFVTHDVRRFILEKPEDYEFVPGQATSVSINQEGWGDKKHPFTFTSLNDDLVLEFIIKGYPVAENPEHAGLTEKLHKLKSGDELLIGEPFGTIEYKGKGVFIAGGAGITPFIAIFRELQKKGELKGNKLIFSNKTQKDVILEKEFKEMFGDDLILTLTQENADKYENKKIDKKFLEEHVDGFSQHFYVCGPPKMVKDMKEILKELGASTDELIFEGKS